MLDPKTLLILLVCIVVVILAPFVFSMVVEYGVPFFKATLRRFFVVRWPTTLARVADVHMSSAEDDEDEPQRNPISAFPPATTIPQNSNNGVATPQNASNVLLLDAKAEALATLVKAGKIGETEGIKLVFGLSPSSSNPRYQAARAALKLALARLDDPAAGRSIRVSNRADGERVVPLT